MIDWRSRLLISERLFIRTDVAVIILSTRAPPSMRARSRMASIAASLASVCLPLSIVLLLSNPRTHDVRTVAMLCRPVGWARANAEYVREWVSVWQRWRGRGDRSATGGFTCPLPPFLILRHHPSINDGAPQPGYCLSPSHSLTVSPEPRSLLVLLIMRQWPPPPF